MNKRIPYVISMMCCLSAVRAFSMSPQEESFTEVSEFDPEVEVDTPEQIPPSPVKFVEWDTVLTFSMTNFYRGVGGDLVLLQQRQRLDNDMALYLGTKLYIPTAWEYNSQSIPAVPENAFAFTHVTNGKPDDHYAFQTVIGIANLVAVAAIGPWVTGYIEFLGGEIVFFNDPFYRIDLFKAFVLFGDLDCSPLYGFIGKKDVDFGSFETRSGNSYTLTRAGFKAANAKQFGIGFYNDELNVVFTSVNGGNNNGFNNFTPENNFLSNFAVNATFKKTWCDFMLQLGGGYLHGSGFTSTSGGRNAVWDANIKMAFQDFVILGEYLRTLKRVPITYHQAWGWNVEAFYSFKICEKWTGMSIGWSEIADGPCSSCVAKQGLANITYEPTSFVFLGLEYCFNQNVQGPPFFTRGPAPISQTLIAGNTRQINHSISFIVTTFW